ncbi:MAG: hypothetical protein ACREHG_04970 [Candidatus Saccharimonadales bacterium]
MTAPQATWKVTSQSQTTEQDTAGNFVSGWRVYFDTNGTTGSVFVPQTIYTADNVRDMITASVGHINDVSNLTS